MAEAKPKPGISRDPWRTAPEPAPPEKPEFLKKRAEGPPTIGEEGPIEWDDLRPKQTTSIMINGYGGITLEGTAEASKVAVHLIDFLVEHEPKIEPILTHYGLLMLKLDEPPKISLYIQRSDGWTLCVPAAETKDEGLLQVVQALLEIDRQPEFKPLLRKYGLRPFTM